MRHMRFVGAAAFVLFCSGMPQSAAQAKDEPPKVGSETKPARNDRTRLADASRTVREIAALPKRKIPPVLFNEAGAVAIFPKVSKNAFMIKGGISGGVLMVRDKSGAWSSPVFIAISGGTLGWQIVGDPMDVVLLFRSSRPLETLLKGRLTLDTKTAIVPGRLAATMKGATKEELGAELTSYVRSHGVFVEEAVVAGTTLQVDAAANDAFYGKTKIDVGEILSGKALKTSEDIAALQKLLGDYAAAK